MKPVDYNHLILYAKGHYKRGSRIEDVKRILAQRCMIDPEHFSDSDAWECAVHALKEHCSERSVTEVLRKIFSPMPGEGQMFVWFSRESNLDRALYYILCELAHLKVIENGVTVLELGNTDPAVLPLNDGTMEVKDEKKVEASETVQTAG